MTDFLSEYFEFKFSSEHVLKGFWEILSSKDFSKGNCSQLTDHLLLNNLYSPNNKAIAIVNLSPYLNM